MVRAGRRNAAVAVRSVIAGAYSDTGPDPDAGADPASDAGADPVADAERRSASAPRRVCADAACPAAPESRRRSGRRVQVRARRQEQGLQQAPSKAASEAPRHSRVKLREPFWLVSGCRMLC